MSGPRFPDECPTCGANSNLRPEGHADWCWTADPSLPNLGDGPPCVYPERLRLGRAS